MPNDSLPTAPSGAQEKPYRIYPTSLAFKRNGFPSVTGQGSDLRHVVIIDTEDFKRLAKLPGLATVQWEVAKEEYEA